MKEKGLFNKIKNRLTRRRFVVSTIRKDENLFETVFEANFFYLPRCWNHPDLALESATPDEATSLHYRSTTRFTQEHPLRLLQEYSQTITPASPPD